MFQIFFFQIADIDWLPRQPTVYIFTNLLKNYKGDEANTLHT